jgi:hypothetical protein
MLFLLLGAALSGLGLPLFFVTLPGRMQIGPPQMILGAAFIVGSLACMGFALLKLWRDRGFALYLHRGGICERRAWGDCVVLFRDVEELKFQATRVFVHGTYAGTVEHLAVRTGPDERMLYFQRKRQEAAKGKGPSEASEVDQLAMLIAGAMAARLAKKETLAWTPRMRLNREGVDIEPQHWWERDLRDMAKSIVGWFRWKEGAGDAWSRVTWDQIDRMTIENGIFRLWAREEPRPRIEISTGAPNFHPGYIVAKEFLRKALAAAGGGVRGHT